MKLSAAQKIHENGAQPVNPQHVEKYVEKPIVEEHVRQQRIKTQRQCSHICRKGKVFTNNGRNTTRTVAGKKHHHTQQCGHDKDDCIQSDV